MSFYHLLIKNLNKYPFGYPVAEESIEILKLLFSEEEAKMASFLPHLPFTFGVSKISSRSKIDTEKCKILLNRMEEKDVIYAREEGGERKYALIPMFPGIFEMQFIRHKEKDLNEKLEKLSYLWKDALGKDLGKEIYNYQTALVRVIPIRTSLSPSTHIFSFEEAEKIVSKSGTIGLVECACRKSQKNCDRPLETCLTFNLIAEHLISKKYARKITTSVALKILEEAEKEGLVHCSTNFRPPVLTLCNCCPCCCTFLKGITKYNKLGAVISSNFQVEINGDNCAGCKRCLDICPSGAVYIKEEKIHLQKEKCLGCGLCVKHCKKNILYLVEKKNKIFPPLNVWGLSYNLSRERKKTTEVIKSYLRDII